MAKIILIDDAEDVRSLVKEILSKEHEIITGSDWAKALPILTKGGIDLVLIDVNMPGLKGDQVAKGLESNFSSKTFDVVLFSAMDEIDLKKKAKEVGAAGYICKTFNEKMLLRKVNKFLKKKIVLSQ